MADQLAVKDAIHDVVASAPTGQSTNVLTTRIAAIPEIKNATNTEDHWYQKRSRWSAIISVAFAVVGPLLAKYGLPLDPALAESVATVMASIGGLWAGYLAYRAGVATKPLGA